MNDPKLSTTHVQQIEGSPDWTNILDQFFTPGASRHPFWLLALDISFACLFAVLVGLLFLTSGNIHIWALLFIECCLWASVKWFIYELQNTPPQQDPDSVEKKNE